MSAGLRPPIVLWDIDGTLLAAEGGGLSHYHRALSAVMPDIALPGLDTHGKTDWQVIHELLEAAGVDRALAPAVSAQLDRNADVFLGSAHATLLPGVSEVLRQLHRRGLRNGLLTGNSELRSRNKLTGAGLDPHLIDWDCSFFGSRSPTRPDLARTVRQTWPDTKLLIVGDTPLDGIAATAADIPFAAICTGVYRREDFAGIGTVAILDALDEHASDVIAGLL
jgi:phosphoglycolate phosphatase-like HAD superfamily hydrolase